jgi:hypothetical protein
MKIMEFFNSAAGFHRISRGLSPGTIADYSACVLIIQRLAQPYSSYRMVSFEEFNLIMLMDIDIDASR